MSQDDLVAVAYVDLLNADTPQKRPDPALPRGGATRAAFTLAAARGRVRRRRAECASGSAPLRLKVVSTMFERTLSTHRHAHQLLHHELRQRVQVGRDDPQQVVGIAHHRMAFEHFGQHVDLLLELLDDRIAMVLELEARERGDAGPEFSGRNITR